MTLAICSLMFFQTDGCSGAEIAALCRDAALLTMKESMDAPFVRLTTHMIADTLSLPV